MLTRERPFTGDNISDTLASVLKTDTNWRTLPATVPTRLRRLLSWCLEKDPRRRLRDIGDARVQLENLINGTADDATTAPPAMPLRPIIAVPNVYWQSADGSGTAEQLTTSQKPQIPLSIRLMAHRLSYERAER